MVDRVTEAGLASEQRLLAAALESVADPVVITDPEGRILWVNPAFTAQNGWTAAEAIGQKPSLLKSRVTDPAIHETLWREILAGRVWSGEVTNRRKDGSEYIALLTVAPLREAGGEVSHFVATHRDITERRRAEASFRTLIENLPEAVAVHRNGRFVYANAKTAELFGFPRPEAMIGQAVLDLVHPDDRPKVIERMQAQKAAPPVEGRIFRPDGRVAVAEVTSVPAPFDGQPSTVVVARDLGPRKALTARMMQLDRAIAVGTLAAGVAHEINNPLAYVTANLDHVAGALTALAAGRPCAEHAAEIAELREAIGEARDGASRIRNIVRDLRTFSRAPDDLVGPVDLVRVLESSINMSWNEIRHRARLEKDYGPLPIVLGNEGRLGQVFVNLLVNAAQAIAEGASERNRIRVVTATDPAGRAVVEIRDTGSGIPPEVLPRIFDPFFTTKPVGQGTGLGLSICQEIVRGFGGEITVESAPGAGTVFRVILPAEKTQAAAVVPPPAEGASGVRGRVLVVDDEPLIGRALGRILTGVHEVTTVTRAAEVLERLDRGERYDVILCDLMMPEMSGMDLHAALLARYPAAAARTIFLTGGAFTPTAREFLDRVPNPRLEKPVDRQRLLVAIDDVVAG